MAVSEQGAKWQQFRKSKMGLAFGLVLTALLAYVTILFVGFLCFSTIIAGALLYFVPRYFGLKSRKKLVIAAFIIMLFLGLALGVTYYTIIKDVQPAASSSGDGIMTAGQVLPFKGSMNDAFNFSVEVSGANSSSEVWVQVYDYFGSSQKRINLTHSFPTQSGQSRVFHEEAQLSNGAYRHVYYFIDSNGKEVTTSMAWGPMTLADGDILSKELYYWMVSIILNVGMWFLFILILTYYMENSKKRMTEARNRMKTAEPAKPGKMKFVCSECGADVPEDANECPQCGEKFEDEEGLKCPSCGKEVSSAATNCWNCGKELKK
jgi:DNA-directed RNA polymerase subunit RPC12/RpoP